MKKAARAFAVVAAAAAVFLALLVASTFPKESGRVRVAGISRPVRIATDARGVPVITAESPEDAFLGLGYVHARDRLWQMEFQRRIGAGRLAEILGPKLVESDRFLRTVGFRRAAEAALPALSQPSRRLLEAYARGVNQFLATSSRRPIEFRLLRVSPEPFSAVDCLVWAKMMAWDLAGHAANEIRRARFAEAVGRERAAELLPPVPAQPTILVDSEWMARASAPPLPPRGARGAETAPRLMEAPAAAKGRASRSERPEGPGVRGSLSPINWPALAKAFDLIAPLGFGGEDLGSNSWVLAGARTKTSKPILANDPHLALRSPSVWYLARIEAPGYSATGATLPGVPGVIIGHNRRVAWGLTSLEPDVQDLYVEKTDPTNPSRYSFRGQWRQFETRTERIRVRGKPDVVLEVRSSVHGPIVTDVFAGAERLGAPVALRWTGLEPGDTTAEAFFRINTAGNWGEFLAGAALLRAPAQNLIYADAAGHIGYTASGAIPIRPRSDGLRPVSGAGEDEWTGFISFERLPRLLDPPRGYVVTANNRVVSEGYPHSFSADWPEPYRAKRIADLLLSREKLGVAEVREIQQDRISYQARELLPLLLDTRVRDAASEDALGRLRSWNGDFAPDSVPASIYAAWYAALSQMPEDELRGAPPGNVRSRFLINALKAESGWCDDIRTARRESCADFKAASLHNAVVTLRAKLGSDPAQWHWSRLHRARFAHGVFNAVPLLRRFFSLETGQGGDASTVNVGAYRRDGSFLMTDGPSYRQIIDLTNWEESLFVHTTGQSGNVFDRRFRDLLPLWREGEYIRIGGSGKAAETLTLQPGP
jgi:penicillin amidase